ncbi:hypothetical protein BDZ90DRAFT_232134 [Jaminaea rosea]|uniref:Uncharacterized protein n=1 Tax=Jaminaea rosea TaxID=1569628 RepID=A0A316USI1_9BASI|nr:hypothetical protein BDZ90DRAFT_232134 [Jaminaea rosea]PWN27738.1 hypothetical protein BDZ90DRAFT_232134 [Jaminaea rosea]
MSASQSEPGAGPGRTCRPHFTTSLADFALPTRSASPSPAVLSPLASTTAAGARPTQQRGLGSYALRPRSSLSRNIITAAPDDGQDDEDDDGGRSTAKGGYDDRGPTSSSSSPFQPHRQPRSPSHTTSYRSAADRDRSRERLTSSYSRMGSNPPLSPRSMRGGERESPFARSMGNRQRASSPMSRRQHLSPEPWSTGVDAASSYGGEDDVELDLDGMDMRMEEAEDDDEESTASSPTKRVAVQRAENHSLAPRGSNAVAPPLRRVLQLLKEESKPGEGEVASEAKVTKRLGAINEAAAASRSMREGSPFATPSSSSSTLVHDADAASGNLSVSQAHAQAQRNAALSSGDDDLLDNVGFESSSDALSSPSSNEGDEIDSDAGYEPASTPASLPDGPDGATLEPANDMQMDEGDDEAMQDDSASADAGSGLLSTTPLAGHNAGPASSSTLFPSSAISTPPPRFSTPSLPSSANVSPVNERGGGYPWDARQHPLNRGLTEAPRTPMGLSALAAGLGGEAAPAAANHSLSISSPSTSSTTSTPTQPSTTGPMRGGISTSSTTGRKRTGSAWTDFRNSPGQTSSSAATGRDGATPGGSAGSLGAGGASSYDRKQHRLHGYQASWHARHHHHHHHHSKAKDLALAAAASRGLSTSPAASTSGAYPGGVAAFNTSRASSPTLASAVTSASTKRKFGFGGTGSDSPGGSSSSSGNANSERGTSGAGERYDPYISSAHKRRALSPLMSLGLGLGSGSGSMSSMQATEGGSAGGPGGGGSGASSPARYHAPQSWYHRNSVTSPTATFNGGYFPPASVSASSTSSSTAPNGGGGGPAGISAAAAAASSSSPLLSAVAPRLAAHRDAAAQAAANAAWGPLSNLDGLGMGGTQDDESPAEEQGREAVPTRAIAPVRRREGTPTRAGRSGSGGGSGSGTPAWGAAKSRMGQLQGGTSLSSVTTSAAATPTSGSAVAAPATGIPPFGEDDAGLGPSLLAGSSSRRRGE